MGAGNEREFIDFQQSKEKGGRPMICPLLAIAWGSVVAKQQEEYPDCLKEECAWWHKENKSCSMLTLAEGNIYIHKVLLDMAGKMPHEEQFRR